MGPVGYKSLTTHYQLVYQIIQVILTGEDLEQVQTILLLELKLR